MVLLSNQIIDSIRSQTIPSASKPKTLINVRDRLLAPLAPGNKAAEEVSRQLNDRLKKMLLLSEPGNQAASGEELLQKANQTFLDHTKKSSLFKEAAETLSVLGHDPRRLFQNYDPDFGIISLPDLPFLLIAQVIAGSSSVQAFTMSGIPIVPDSALSKAKAGDKEALLAIRHERAHFSYRAIHKEPLTLETRLITELHAYYASYIDVYGIDSLRQNVFGAGEMYDALVLSRLENECEHQHDLLPADTAQGQAMIDSLMLRAAAANALIARLLAVSEPQSVLAYLITLTSLERAIAMEPRRVVVNKTIEFYDRHFSDIVPDWSRPELPLEHYDEDQFQYALFAGTKPGPEENSQREKV
ncbi:MAG: hypothetical protein WC632_01395 [Candidatus Margulisiibacteriota bacterium]